MSEDSNEVNDVLQHTVSGGVAVNDVMSQIAVTGLPFGGLEQSGMGRYRGKASMDTVSHRRFVVTVPTSEEYESTLEWRYADGDADEKLKFVKDNLKVKLET